MKPKFYSPFVANFMFSVFPNTRWFYLKALVMRMLGYNIALSAKLTGDIKIYGRGRISVGSESWIGIGCRLFISSKSELKIGNNCDIAPQATFHNGTHEIGNNYRRAARGVSLDINIGSGVWIGTRATITAGAQVCSGVIIGAASLLIKNVYNDDTLYGGVPAKEIRKLSSDNSPYFRTDS